MAEEMKEVKGDVKNCNWRHSSHIAWRKVADEAVILDMDTAVYYSLNEVGTRIWELLVAGGRSVPEVIQAVAEEYDAAEGSIQRDVHEFIRNLQKEKVIEQATDPEL